ANARRAKAKATRNTRARKPRAELLESRRLLTGATLFEFPITVAAGSPFDIAAGPDGNLWFTEEVPDQIGVFHPSTGTVTQISLPSGVAPQGITAGPDGNLWFTEALGNNGNGQIAAINPTTQTPIALVPLPSAASYPTNIVAGPDGNLWFTETSVGGHKAQIGMVNLTTHALSEFPLNVGTSQPSGITVGPDGNLWFAENGSNSIGVINPTTHAIHEFAVPTPNADPFMITTGADGNLWFTETNKNNSTQSWQLGMINPITDQIQEVPLPSGGWQPLHIISGPDGNLWFTAAPSSGNGNGSIWAINPVTHSFSDWLVQTANAVPIGITSGPGGNLDFTERTPSLGSIGEVAPDLQLSFTSQPSRFVAPGGPFGVTVTVQYDSGMVDTAYNGPVTIALLNPGAATLGGTLTVNAQAGLATFTGLSISQAGTGYRLMAYTLPSTTTLSAPITVGVAPTIVAEKAMYVGKGRRRHLVGFQLNFSKPLAAAPAQFLANYTVTQTMKRRGAAHGKAIRLASAVYDGATESVLLTIAGKAAFLGGGTIVVNAGSPGGLTDTAGEPLDGTGTGVPGVNATLLIAPRARRITLAT
ncbi:MAG: Vgb family protein, partial [Isosphaeraceae bacterium]